MFRELIISNCVMPAFLKAKLLVESEGGHIFFLYKKNGLFVCTKGAVAKCLHKSTGVTVSAVERVSINSANLYAVDSNCICVSLGYYVAVKGKGKAQLIFKNLS